VLVGCGKTMLARENFEGRTNCTTAEHSCRMLKKAGLLTHPTPARQDAPCPRQGRSKRSLTTLLRGGWDDPNCARPTRAFSSRALREHGDRPSYPTSFFSILQEGGQRLMTISRATLPLGPKGF
jgi:hypothetical protein